MSNGQAREGSGENAQLPEETLASNRRSNLEQLGREVRGRARLAQITRAAIVLCFVVLIVAACMGLIAAASVGLISAAFLGPAAVIVASSCGFIFSVAFLFRVTKQIEQLEKLRGQILAAEEVSRRKREGLRKRDADDTVVDAFEWRPEFNISGTDWVEGEVRQLLPGDTVLKFAWQINPLFGRGGYAIERNGKIVAQHYTWIS